MQVNVIPGLGSEQQNAWQGDVPLPESCPFCHKSVLPLVQQAWCLSASNEGPIACVMRCPRESCQQLFLAYCSYQGARGGRGSYRLDRIGPGVPVPAQFDDAIANVSANFVAIYNQAAAAEHHGLDQIAGMGYRKALEFLVKDFLIHQDPSNEERIKKTLLGAVINQYIDDANLKACAARATWLGNDETHYVRRWLDRDISDLKKLIRLTVLWMERILYTKEFLEEMPDPNAPGG